VDGTPSAAFPTRNPKKQMTRESFLKMGRPQNACVRCGKALAETGHHLSALATTVPDDDDENAELRREDYCRECWAEIEQKTFVGFWMARREPPKPGKAKSRRERNLVLASLFDFLRESGDPANAQKLFVLAHLLMKFQVLRWLRTEDPAEKEGPSLIVFRHALTGEEVSVETMQLDEEDMAMVVAEIDEYIQRAQVPQADAKLGESAAAEG
jgi:hypothetical protein